MAIPENAIHAIARAGFDVYMRKPSDTYLLFTDGTRIGYMQENRLGGLSLHTVHMPNTTSGTGFSVVEDLSVEHLTPATLAKAFMAAPDWAWRSHAATVRKWKDWAAYQAANSFNASYRRVAEGVR